jgi:Mor family transcriptional regulator
MANTAPRQDPEFLSDLAAKLAALLVEEGLPRERADAITRMHVEAIRRDWGGLRPYISMGRALDNDKRDAEIARRWNGTNARELCREFQISEPHLRRILAGRGKL